MSNDVSTQGIERCDLCIIGAGIAGLNALAVAAEYLPRGARVVLIDANRYAGGMWTWVYGYNRLHQPHPTFTVGDRKWDWTRPADYLARGEEVSRHLERCFIELSRKLDLVERFGHRVTTCRASRAGALVTFFRTDRPEAIRELQANRVINAIGYDIPRHEPLPLSSAEVVSKTPRDLGHAGMTRDRSPVYVVGGGKTGMDTALALISRSPGRRVVLINGTGTLFLDRDKLFPPGWRRWWRGVLVADLFRDLALRFDGTNEDAVHAHLRDRYAHGVGPAGRRFMYGLLSRRERKVLSGELDELIEGYLADVVDGPAGPEMILRGGARRPVERGAIFVNCTGHLMRGERPYEPYLSHNGAILTITPRSMVHFLSSASAYYLSHLFFRGELARTPLYELDGEMLNRLSPRAYIAASATLTYLNTLVFLRRLPVSVVTRCGLDFDRLFPLHRRLRALVGAKALGARRAARCRKSLDALEMRFGVRCGPLYETPQFGGGLGNPTLGHLTGGWQSAGM